MEHVEHHTPRVNGWQLDLRQYWDPDTLEPSQHPVLMVPGYGMNAYVLGYHPGGPSMIDYLVERGFEVWTANLRGQGHSRRVGQPGPIGFKQVVLEDLERVLRVVRSATRTETPHLHAVGASLGATYLYAWMAHHPKDHPFASLVSIGGPLRWEKSHPLMRLVFRSPWLAGAVPIRGVKPLARAVLPVVRKFPALLSLYMNADIIDLTAVDRLTQTVDDPFPHMNRQIAHWLKDDRLVVDGVDVYEAVRQVSLPILLVIANADGIVPPEAVRSVRGLMPRAPVDELFVGDEQEWFAHADLFVSRNAQSKVFEPMARWLKAHHE